MEETIQELLRPKEKKNKLWIPTIIVEFNVTTGISRPLVQKSKHRFKDKEAAVERAYSRVVEYLDLEYVYHKDSDTLERAIWPMASVAGLKAIASSEEEILNE